MFNFVYVSAWVGRYISVSAGVLEDQSIALLELKWQAVWVLRTELKSSGRTVYTLHQGAMFPAPESRIFIPHLSFSF